MQVRKPNPHFIKTCFALQALSFSHRLNHPRSAFLPLADGLSQLQTALSSTEQFQQMFEELRSWLDKQAEARESPSDSLPCQPEAIRSLLAQTAELQRGVASQRGSYELIQAEGVSLLTTLPAGGDERSALQSCLTSLRQDWEALNERISDRESRLRSTLGKADTYQQLKGDLAPWLAECEQKDAEIQPSLGSSTLEEALQKAKSLSLDLERRQPLLEAFNTAADQLLEQCCIGEEEVQPSFIMFFFCLWKKKTLFNPTVAKFECTHI